MHDWHRHDVVNLLDGNDNLGVELGVAEGVYSERMVASGRFKSFIGIDMYADVHDIIHYKRALSRVGLFKNYHLLRMKFDEAIDLFEDNSIDFIYVDGYAHTGEEGGETIFSWFKKLKIGGVMAGDDYSESWPLVVKAVDEFATQTGLELHITGKTETNAAYCRFPSWAVVKAGDIEIEAPKDLLSLGKSEGERIAKIRSGKSIIYQVRRKIRKHMHDSIIKRINQFRNK